MSLHGCMANLTHSTVRKGLTANYCYSQQCFWLLSFAWNKTVFFFCLWGLSLDISGPTDCACGCSLLCRRKVPEFEVHIVGLWCPHSASQFIWFKVWLQDKWELISDARWPINTTNLLYRGREELITNACGFGFIGFAHNSSQRWAWSCLYFQV